MKPFRDYLSDVLNEGIPTAPLAPTAASTAGQKPTSTSPTTPTQTASPTQKAAQDLVKQATGTVPDADQQEQDREGLGRDDEVAVDDNRFKGKPVTFVSKAGNIATVRDETGKTASVPFDKVMMMRKAADVKKQQQAQANTPGAPATLQSPNPTGPVGESREIARLRALAGLRSSD